MNNQTFHIGKSIGATTTLKSYKKHWKKNKTWNNFNYVDTTYDLKHEIIGFLCGLLFFIPCLGGVVVPISEIILDGTIDWFFVFMSPFCCLEIWMTILVAQEIYYILKFRKYLKKNGKPYKKTNFKKLIKR